MNAVIMNKETPLSLVMSMAEAENMLAQIKAIYPNACLKETDQEVKKKFEYKGVAEVIEDVGCAGGACAL